MPSDPSGVIPRGTLVRSAPDWFDDNLGTGAFFRNGELGPDNFNYCTVALFNNSPTSTALKVYGLTAISDGGSGMGLYWVNAPVGALVGGCQPLRPDLGAPSGQIYQQVALHSGGAVPNPFFTDPPAAIFACDGFDSASYFSPFPLFIVPVGWSAVLTNLTASIDLGAAFWFQQANE